MSLRFSQLFPVPLLVALSSFTNGCSHSGIVSDAKFQSAGNQSLRSCRRLEAGDGADTWNCRDDILMRASRHAASLSHEQVVTQQIKTMGPAGDDEVQVRTLADVRVGAKAFPQTLVVFRARLAGLGSSLPYLGRLVTTQVNGDERRVFECTFGIDPMPGGEVVVDRKQKWCSEALTSLVQASL